MRAQVNTHLRDGDVTRRDGSRVAGPSMRAVRLPAGHPGPRGRPTGRKDVSPVSRTQRFSPTRVALVVAAAAGALALTGCGAGQIAQTSDQQAAVAGANLTSGHIAVRNAEIEFPDVPTRSIAVYRTGGAAPLSMTVANESGQPDRLLSASTPYAASVRLEG